MNDAEPPQDHGPPRASGAGAQELDGAQSSPGESGTPGSQGPRALTRSRRDRILGGVAGGIGAYLGVDPALARIAFILLSFVGGLGILLYLVLWVVVPEEQAVESLGDAALRQVSEAPAWAKAVLVAVGVLVIGAQLGPRGPSVFWALALITVGVVLWRRDDRLQQAGDGPGEPGAEPSPSSRPAAAASRPPAHPGGTVGGPSPPGTATGWGSPVTQPTRSGIADRTASQERGDRPAWPEARAARPRSLLAQLTVAALLLASGAAALLDRSGVIALTFEHFLALVLVVIGLGLVAGAWWGRSRGLIVLGALIIPVLLAANLLAVPLQGGVGEQIHRPASVEEVADEYRLSVGVTILDLSRVAFGPAPTPVRASVGVGELQVIVPADAHVELDGRVTAGAVDTFGDWEEGIDLRRSLTDRGSELGGRLELDVRTGLGLLTVRRADQDALGGGPAERSG